MKATLHNMIDGNDPTTIACDYDYNYYKRHMKNTAIDLRPQGCKNSSLKEIPLNIQNNQTHYLD